MKTSHLAAVSAAVIFASTLAAPNSLAVVTAPSTIPSMPIGVLSAYPTVVQTGTKPTLNWSILYPSKVSDVATLEVPGTLTTTTSIFAAVQIIGTGVTSGDPTQGTAPTYADLRMSVGTGTYKQLFYGTQADVNLTQYLYSSKLNSGTTINFGGRYVKDGAWTPFYTSKSTNHQVVALRNGDTIPTDFALNLSTQVASYLKPYLDSTGKVKLGPMSVLVVMELGQTNHSATSFDYQDLACLVSFSTLNPKNNGNGNNVDGVDSSNPGGGCGGPNGGIDPSGGIDDEIK